MYVHIRIHYIYIYNTYNIITIFKYILNILQDAYTIIAFLSIKISLKEKREKDER